MKKTIDKKVFGERLKSLMKKYNETTYSLGKVFNLSPPTISRYTRGEMEPKMTTVKAMANYFNVSADWLIGISSSIYDDELLDDLDTDQRTNVPVFNTIKYDTPIFSNEKIEETITVPSSSTSKWGAFIAYQVPDDSMAPILMKKDRVIIKLNPELRSSNLTALHVNQSDLIIRKTIIHGNRIILQPANINYNAEIYNLNKDNIQIIGDVVFCQRVIDFDFTEN